MAQVLEIRVLHRDAPLMLLGQGAGLARFIRGLLMGAALGRQGVGPLGNALPGRLQIRVHAGKRS